MELVPLSIKFEWLVRIVGSFYFIGDGGGFAVKMEFLLNAVNSFLYVVDYIFETLIFNLWNSEHR